MSGSRRMEYDCESQGCFNKKRRLQFHFFDGCFPGKISLTDIDGCCEINGNQLWIEFKSYEGELSTGQRKLFINQTSPLLKKFNMVFVVVGNAETMVLESVMTFKDGCASGIEECDLEKLRKMVKQWADRAYDISWQCE